MSWPGLVLITGGGTGGHVFPGIAAASALQAMGARVHWLGTRRGMESRLVPQAGIPLSFLRVSGLRGKNWWQRLLAPVLLLLAVLQAMVVIVRLRPVCVLGTGGFVAAPGGLAAWLLRRPLVIHEQNAVAGSTNRLLARLAARILSAFPQAFPGGRPVQQVGNPVRAEIAAIEPPALRLGERQGALRLLVIGGSQGSMAINRSVVDALTLLPPGERPELWHQCGQRDFDNCRQAYHQAEVQLRLEPFIDRMQEAYAWADLVICRAGALTVAELAAAGVAALFVPLPGAIDDHQRANARWLVDAGAGLLVEQSELDGEWLAKRLRALAADRALLLRTALNARAMARPRAAQDVASACREVANAL